MKTIAALLLSCCAGLVWPAAAWAQSATTPAAVASGADAAPFDAALAQSLGADDIGMRRYVLVILKSGPTPVPAGPERDAMFKGHFSNMTRLSAEGTLALAGPLDGVDGWRGLYVFAVAGIDEAQRLVATDPVIQRGEMVAEYHAFYGSAALMLVRDAHPTLARKKF
ncbi:MAG: YciI family protein [Rubrivivax sp.]